MGERAVEMEVLVGVLEVCMLFRRERGGRGRQWVRASWGIDGEAGIGWDRVEVLVDVGC